MLINHAELCLREWLRNRLSKKLALEGERVLDDLMDAFQSALRHETFRNHGRANSCSACEENDKVVNR